MHTRMNRASDYNRNHSTKKNEWLVSYNAVLNIYGKTFKPLRMRKQNKNLHRDDTLELILHLSNYKALEERYTPVNRAPAYRRVNA